jgi:hypothetical protein
LKDGLVQFEENAEFELAMSEGMTLCSVHFSFNNQSSTTVSALLHFL